MPKNPPSKAAPEYLALSHNNPKVDPDYNSLSPIFYAPTML